MFDKIFKYGIVLTGMLENKNEVVTIKATLSIRDRLGAGVEDIQVIIAPESDEKSMTWKGIQDMLRAFSRSTNIDGDPTSALGTVLGHFVVSVNPQALDTYGKKLGLPVGEFRKSKGPFRSSVITKEWRHSFPAAESPTQKRERASDAQEAKKLLFENV